ncbi:DNA excision repair protein ERCC-6-like protein [Auxenochlorella protothecoides]|uniref:DNA excision repair protein ERCC-6-like protein n=1 Tax=Auxenochlorella protothecoides TaxID=3075 RepID=A0A087SA08_AUXPR|nr:DNA excision repair protein ERCC-6-like protein [Auxenochlorella protothecoides]KFM22562.1 DNA excision repair protein ERCC-6-like protein [Auxenochlorella protothecoides]
MVDEEDYHFFGAPLVDESDVQPFQRSDPAATRSLPLHQQEVKDDQGRRRFHGAFTGGYSAGYFNSVGSKEGWTPAAFSSSQGARAGVRQSVEQFLDEDELEQYRKRHLQTTAAYDTFGATAAEASRRAVWEQAATRPQAVPGLLPEDVIAPVADSVGIQLLRRMGWRQGRGLGGRPDAAGSRGAAGSEVISGTARETGAALASLLPPAPKTDLHGIGYDPFRGAREFEAAKRARLEAGRRQSGAAGSVPRRHPGVAFGTGVLEEDDAEGIMDDYVVHGDVGGEVESVNADARGLPARRGPGVQRVGLGDRLLAGGYSFEIQEHLAHASFIPGFSRARRSTVTPSFPAPVIPRDWVSPRRRAKPPGASAPLPSRQATPALLARVVPPSDPALRQAIDSLAFYVARSGGASEDLVRSTQVQNGAGHSFLLGGPGSAYYAWKVHTLRELMAPGQAGRDQGPSAGPPAAPGRKAAFTSAEERGRALGETPLPSQPGAVDTAAVSGAESSRGGPPAPRRDVLLSVAAADRLRLAGMLSRSFVSGSAEAGGFGGEDKHAPGAAPRLPIRRSKEWRPAALLCKRFNVPDPFHGRPREVEPSRFKTDFLALPDTAAAAADFGFSKLRSERGSVRGAGAEDSAGPRLAEDPAPAAGGIHGLDPALRQRVESTLKSLGKRERKENKRSKEKRSKHHKGDLASKLYPYQREGVSWLWRLYQLKTGGILADDMGLGKTMQCCAFLAGMLESGLLRRALVVAPKTLLAHWKGELQVCGLSQRTHEFVTGTSPGAQTRALKSTAGGCGILLTTYGMLQHNAPSLASHPSHDADEGALWDLMILDEGHKLKNPKTELRHKCDYIPARSRVVISGTPIQNNLRELWALFDFTTPDLLGNANSFKDVYEKWILAGNDRSAMPEARERGAAAAAQLRTRIAPYMLRREKGAMHAAKEGENAAPGAATIPAETERALPKWTHKSDFIIWLQLKPLQLSLYQSVLNSSRSALGALTVLKKICDHPALVSERAQREMMAAPTTDEAGQAADADVETSEEVAVLTEDCPTWLGAREEEGLRRLLAAVDESTFLASCKTEFVLGLLRHLVGSGHKTLVFSQSTKMLTILETAIRKEGVRMVRIDGQVASVDERAARVHAFQTCPDILVFLLSSAVGGLGLTLTAADRVIIVDPAWNPAVDNQAVDRAYRIGQQRDVVVYRLISCGTLEEKIYRKQVFKAGLSRTGTEDGEQHKYFAQQELRDLLKLDLAEVHASPTLRILNEMHAGQRRLTPQLSEHLRFLETLAGFAGVSDHDLLYTEKEANPVKLTQRVEEDYRKAAAAPPGTVSAPASIKGRAGGSATKKAAAKGWVGEGELSEKFARAMDLHRGSGESRAPFQPPRRAESSAAEAAAVALAGLRQALAKQRQLLTNAALLSGLADGGARVRRRVAELEAEVAQAEAVLARHAPPSGALTDASTEDKSSSVAPEATSAFAKEVAHLEWRYRRAKMVGMEAG